MADIEIFQSPAFGTLLALERDGVPFLTAIGGTSVSGMVLDHVAEEDEKDGVVHDESFIYPR